MSLYGTFKTDQSLERQGRWFDLSNIRNADNSNPGFRMARMAKANPTYQAAMERQSKELRQAVELDILTEDVAGPIMRGVFVDTILLDWRNVFDEQGFILPFTKENALKLFEDLPDLYQILVEEARKLSNFRNAEVEAVSKKSSRQSKPLSDNSDT